MKHLLCAILITLTFACPQAAIRWIDRDFDFGLMKEIAGPKTGQSRFVNVGTDTISIIYVRPSCGCTSADYTKEPIAPGDTATVSYTYDPNMRPGKFLKSVKVELSDGERFSIKISGNVLGTPESLSLMYPVEAGAMRLSDSVVNAHETDMGHTPVYFVNAYSLSLDSISPRLKAASPALSVSASHHKAGPGDLITFSLNFDSHAYGKYGPVEIPLTFTANTADPEPVDIRFRAFVLPDTERLKAQQKGINPVANIPTAPINIGTDITDKTNCLITAENLGNGPLHFLSVSPQSSAIIFAKLPKEVKPGKTANLKFTLDPSSLPSGPFRLPIDIITDDADHPHKRIYITGSKL